MWRRAAWVAAIAAGAAALAGPGGGCDSAPREIHEAKPIRSDESRPAVIPSDKAPEKSDADALAVVKEAIAAHTANHPERLQPLRSCTYVRAGHLAGAATGTAPVKQTWTVHAGWPDRFRAKIAFEGAQDLTIAWRPGGGWQHVTGKEKEAFSSQKVEELKLDITGEWLELIFPLAEPGLIVAPAPDGTFNNRPATGVRIWHPELSDAVVHFDKETRLLSGITYEGREAGRKVTKEITVLSHRDYAGVMLPERTVVRSNNNVLFEWTMTSLEPKPSLDPKLFEDL